LALPSVLATETAGLKAWPGLETAYDGGWVLRAANGYTKRANSVQSLDPGDDKNAEARILAADSWFRARNLTPVFRVTPLAGPAILSALDDLRWARIDDSHFFAMELGPQEAHPRASILPIDDPAFFAAQQKIGRSDDRTMANLRAVVGVLTVPCCGIVFRNAEGDPVSTALMAIADGIVITGNVKTEPLERRKGHAAAMMRSGLAWAHSKGATVAALNVQADNPPAIALYQSLGYGYQYDYSYRLPVAK
jgi:N-acetylglutamate synthase